MLDADFWGQAESLSVSQMAIRGAVIFWVGYLLLRIGGWKIFGKKSALDYVIIIVIGSVLSKIIIGDAAFFPATAACLTMVLFHRLISRLCARFNWLSHLLEGKPIPLYGDGQIYWKNLRASSISYQEFMQSLRLEMNTENLQTIESAMLESSGRISFIPKQNN
ncbi:DUF421 domain-containing protein [Arachidicoccus terrestris]|uniref:DUF421 domain-containing protein n=1 Tax=Arachidicoccus terrestris TaxID=2875539 RepID=UPI001CC4F6A4|nr:YetF domain-containing protein [Arachidicoccus terrestris]UAY55903.1 DUF421 domain-containing protein [Arachidicoccus terrestris]